MNHITESIQEYQQPIAFFVVYLLDQNSPALLINCVFPGLKQRKDHRKNYTLRKY